MQVGAPLDVIGDTGSSAEEHRGIPAGLNAQLRVPATERGSVSHYHGNDPWVLTSQPVRNGHGEGIQSDKVGSGCVGYSIRISVDGSAPHARRGAGGDADGQSILAVDARENAAIADSKRVSGKHNAPAHKHVLIITYPKTATPEAVVPPKAEKADPAPFPAPVVEPIVIAPVVPTPAPVVPSKPVPVAPVQAKWTGLRGQLTWVVGRLTGRIAK